MANPLQKYYYYPKSFLKLLLLGFIVVVVPLGWSLIDAAFDMARLAQRSQQAVYDAAQAARGSRELAEVVTGMERTLRQYLILGDASLLENFQRLHDDFQRAAGDMSRLKLGKDELAKLSRMVSLEDENFGRLLAVARGGVPDQEAAQDFVALTDLAQSFVADSNRLIEREVDQMRQDAAGMQRTLYMRLAAIIPSAVVAALIFTFLIARPIRQLDNAIRRLGSADLTTPVSVSGPGDLVYLGERLDWLRRRLVELEAQKVKFMRAVSHELKTPLTALREGAALLHDGSTGELSEEQRSVARILFQNSVQLQKLIEDLLNYQRFQSSDVPLRCEEFDLAELARQVAIDHDLAARARGIRFDFSTRRCPVSADRSHIRTVIDNLYTNAVKYSPHDSQIRIRVSPGQQLAVLEVQDAGPGVPEDERELIFEPFYQGRIPPEGPVKGSGLGLAIARELAAEHDGQLTLSSNGNQGTVFRLELPRSQAAQHLLVRQ